jgi:hypothetical protein
LLVMVNIASDILGVFMVSLRIRDGPLSPFLKNITIDLSSTSEMIFLLLRNHWMNSWRDSPFFCMTLSGSQLTPRRAHVVRMLQVNSQHKWF